MQPRPPIKDFEIKTYPVKKQLDITAFVVGLIVFVLMLCLMLFTLNSLWKYNYVIPKDNVHQWYANVILQEHYD